MGRQTEEQRLQIALEHAAMKVNYEDTRRVVEILSDVRAALYKLALACDQLHKHRELKARKRARKERAK